MNLSIIVPVFNNFGTIRNLYENISNVFSREEDSFEIIFVNDGSQDDSWAILAELQAECENVKIINLGRNFGQHNATVCGLNFASGDLIVTIDADLQHPAKEIPKLVREMDEGHDVVYGIYAVKKHAFIRNLFSSWIYRMTSKTMNIDKLSSFRIMKREIAELISESTNYDIVLDVIIGWTTKKISYVTVQHAPAEKSSYSMFSLFAIAIDYICNFTVLPLRVASISGCFFSFIALLLGLYYFIMKIFGQIDVSGFTALVVSVLFFSGLILSFIGIIGEYLARIYLKINRKPQYIITEKRGF